MAGLARELGLHNVLYTALYELHRWYPPDPVIHDPCVFTDRVAVQEEALTREDLQLCLFSGVALRIATHSTFKAIMDHAARPWNLVPGTDHNICAKFMQGWLKTRFNDLAILKDDSFTRNPIWDLKELTDDMAKEWTLRSESRTLHTYRLPRLMLIGVVILMGSVGKVCYSCRAMFSEVIDSARYKLWYDLPRISSWSGELLSS